MASDVQVQIERRRRRAAEEIARIANRDGHPVYGSFEVVSRSGNRYRVEIRSLEEPHNSCTCPDYRTNLIGTCKHIEGVLGSLRERYGEELGRLAGKRPAAPSVYLEYGQEIAVRLAGAPPRRRELRALMERHFDPQGVLVGDPLVALPALLGGLERLPAGRRVRVDPAVQEHLELVRDRDAVERQKAWWLGEVRAGRRSFDLLAHPLYPFQEAGALHLAFGRRAMLADDMGLGKTVQAIAAAALLKELRGIGRVLVVTPASLKHQWAREIRRFSSLGASVVEGPAKVRRQIYHSRAFFLILNYELVRYDLEELERLQPDLVILDEAQRIKNWRTKTAAAVKRLRSRYAFVLSGTPLENRLDELYSIFQFLDPRILGPLWRFNDRFYQLERRRSGRYRVLGYKNLGELRRLMAPYVVRRRREEVLHDLPERTVNNFFVPMTEAQWKAYRPFAETVARLASLAERRALTPDEEQILLNSLVKMRLIANALALHEKDIPAAEVEKTAPKLVELAQVLEETMAGEDAKALIFSRWSGMLALVEPVLERLGLGWVTLTGDVPTRRRGSLIDRFFEDPECRVFLSTDAGGLGLNLQAASVVINLDLPWNPAVLEQRVARAHRQGQTRSVQVINLIAQGSIEERILDTLAAKRRVFSGVLDEGELPEAITFQDTGQSLLQLLRTMLDGSGPPLLELEPARPEAEEARRGQAPEPALDFAHQLMGRLPGRVLLVGRPGAAEGVLVVVDREPSELRSQVESVLAECLGPQPPPLHLMEREGYQALTALLPADRSGETIYRSPALPDPAARAGGGREGLDEARKGLDQAARRLAFAELARGGGFHEEAGGPLAEALGWALSSLLALAGAEVSPSRQLPPPRLVQTALVEAGSLPEELAGRLARVRELATPDGEGGPAPLSPRTVEQLVSAVGELVQLGREAAVRASL